MFTVIPGLSPSRVNQQFLFSICAAVLLSATPANIRAQKEGPDTRPAFSDFKGVHIGTPAEEARKRLGSPRDKSAEQDFYLFNDTQAVQVFYDKSGVVNAISIDFMNGATGIPSCKEVLGDEAPAKPDGSVYKMTRYPKAGFWVSYSRTAGDSPTVTITMQRIEH